MMNVCCNFLVVVFVVVIAADDGTVSCPLLMSPQGGAITITSTRVGARVTFTCTTSGFVLQGSAERVCQDNGTWSGVQPTCERESSSLFQLKTCRPG